jgi:hypothetical protein
MTREEERLIENRERTSNWLRWGPYLSERQWGTVREDYSAHGHSWSEFPHDHARSRVYRWSEDGLNGWSDRKGRLCFAPALWNGQDPILKERLFGFGGHEGNHGEDVKECYYYLDSTPTHSYTKALYKYPQTAYPYNEIGAKNATLTRKDPEVELAALGVFDEGRYFDIVQEVTKRTPQDLLWRITATNHGPDAAPLHVLPSLWFRNIWEGGNPGEKPLVKPHLKFENGKVLVSHEGLGEFVFEAESSEGEAQWMFTENETNKQATYGTKNTEPHTKDAFHRLLIDKEKKAVNPQQEGTKAAAHFQALIPPGASITIRCRLHHEQEDNNLPGFEQFDETFEARIRETDEFYASKAPEGLTEQETLVFRQGNAGLLWTKQFYHYVVENWIEKNPDGSPTPQQHKDGRNSDWSHLYARDVLSMPDKWEYPWFAAWDSAFHMVPFAAIDPDFAKSQLLLLLREWYMHPNGQLPAYEWNFSDVNPPVHAWSVWRVYKIADPKGSRDLLFLERAFQKLLLNFTWWVNRKDSEGRHVFGGGFLGLDNIGVFDRSHALPDGAQLNQADGTAWMASYCLIMLTMSLELAREKPAYEDIASKFFEHFVNIADAINSLGGSGLWHEEDGFYYDQLIIGHDQPIHLRTRSLVGLLPLCATMSLTESVLKDLPDFKKRVDWFLANRPDLIKYFAFRRQRRGTREAHMLLAIASEERLRKTLERMLDPKEFLSNFGIRSLSKIHKSEPFVFSHGGQTNEVHYTPGESETGMFGGNSNWRGPIWFPTNYLLIDALERYYFFYGDSFTIEYPTGSGDEKTLREVAIDLCDRLISLFIPNKVDGQRPCFGAACRYRDVPHWQNLVLFHEYFHAETGEGLGASHQTGWTSLVICLLTERRKKLLQADPTADPSEEILPI